MGSRTQVVGSQSRRSNRLRQKRKHRSRPRSSNKRQRRINTKTKKHRHRSKTRIKRICIREHRSRSRRGSRSRSINCSRRRSRKQKQKQKLKQKQKSAPLPSRQLKGRVQTWIVQRIDNDTKTPPLYPLAGDPVPYFLQHRVQRKKTCSKRLHCGTGHVAIYFSCVAKTPKNA